MGWCRIPRRSYGHDNQVVCTLESRQIWYLVHMRVGVCEGVSCEGQGVSCEGHG